MTDFAARHIGPDEAVQRHMLASLLRVLLAPFDAHSQPG